MEIQIIKQNQNLKHWFISGILLGITAVFRANILLLFIFINFWLIWKYINVVDFRKTALRIFLLFSLGTAIPIIPITIRNMAVEDDFVILTANGGINFYIGNNENALGVFVTPTEFDFNNDLAGRKYAEDKLGKKLTASEASEYWYQKGFDSILSEPGDAFLLLSF